MPEAPPIRRAFVLGAGLGTRLRPLTEKTPKPLLPARGRPLVAFALDHLAGLGVRKAVVNTHHAAGEWAKAFPDGRHGAMALEFRHEPVLLDTGGGLKNVEDFFTGGGTFLAYNGDLVTDLPLAAAVAAHRAAGNTVTMVLRSGGGPRHVALREDGRVRDIRGLLGTGAEGRYVFTGIHVLEPGVFREIPDASPRPIIPIYLDMVRRGLPVGGVVLDEGEWRDLGTLEDYRRFAGG
jgi:NDP-sugar pyrophosphorylase family protein